MERARGSSPAGYTFSPRWPASNSHGPHGQGRRLDVGRPDLDHASDRGVAGPKDQRVGERVAGQVEDVLAGEPVEAQLAGTGPVARRSTITAAQRCPNPTCAVSWTSVHAGQVGTGCAGSASRTAAANLAVSARS